MSKTDSKFYEMGICTVYLPFKLVIDDRIVEINTAVEICFDITNLAMHAVAASLTGARLLPTRFKHSVRTISLTFSLFSVINSVIPNNEPCRACQENVPHRIQ